MKNYYIKSLLIQLLFCYCCYGNYFCSNYIECSPQKDSIPVFNVKKYSNLLIVTPQFGYNTIGFAIKYSIVHPLKNHKNSALGLSLFMERLELNKNYALPGNVSEVKIGYFTPGISLIHRISHYFCLQAGISFLIGREEVSSYYYTARLINNAN